MLKTGERLYWYICTRITNKHAARLGFSAGDCVDGFDELSEFMPNIFERQFSDIPPSHKPELNRLGKLVAILPNHFADQTLYPISSDGWLDIAGD